MTRFARILWAALPALLPALAVHAAQAAAPAVQLTLVPEEVTLAAGESAQVVATVEAGEAALADVALQPAAVGGLTVEPAAPETWERIEAGGSRSRVLTVRRDGGRGGVGVLPLRLTWRLAAAAGGGAQAGPAAGQGSRVAKLTVKDSADRLMSGIATLEVKSAIEKIEDRRHGGMAYVVVTNLTSHPLRLTGVQCYAPYFLTVRGGRGTPPRAGLWIAGALSRRWQRLRAAPAEPAGGDAEPAAPESAAPESACSAGLSLPATLEAGSSRALPFQVTASVVEPGKHTVAWEVELEWTRGGEAQRGSRVVDKDFTVGVLGESTLLTLFAWPSILVLPGALMLLTWTTLRKRVWPKQGAGLSATEDAGKAEFWLVAVVLSFLTALLYPWLTGKLGDPRDFIVVHGLDDIVNLWLGAVAAALTAWALWYGGKVAVTAAREWYRQRKMERALPQPMDDPLTVLDKLARTGRGALLAETATLTRGGRSQDCLVVFDAGDDGVWVGPPVLVVCADAAAKEDLEPLREDAQALPGAIRRGLEEKRVVRVQWKAVAGMPLGLEKTTDEALTRGGTSNRLVELDVGK